MDFILVLLGLAVLALPVLVIVALVGLRRLRNRVRSLERRLGELERPSWAVPARPPEPLSGLEPNLAPSEVQTQVPMPAPGSVPQAAAASALGTVAGPAPPSSASDAAARPPGQAAAVPAPATAPEASGTPWDRAAARWRTEGPGAITAGHLPPARPSLSDRLVKWLTANWVYAVSALSLALAGIFLVQYGIEKGLLPPSVRVVAAILLGLVLIGAGERLRRRYGDEGPQATANLPSVFSGAGLVTIFAAVLAARQMYGLISAEVAFAGHLVTAALAVGLGWFHGPLLVAFGLLGAAAAPFIVSGESAAGPWLYGYFLLMAAVGLAVDAVRRWNWVSGLALVLSYGGGWLVLQTGAGLPGVMLQLLALVALAVILPRLQLVPRHEGPGVLMAIVASGAKAGGTVTVPVVLAAAAVLVSTVLLLLQIDAPEGEAMLALVALTGLALALIFWADRAEGLVDLAFVPALGLLTALILTGAGAMALQQGYEAGAIDARPPEAPAPMTVALLLGFATLVGLGFAWRSQRSRGLMRWIDTGFAVLLAPLAAVALDLLWHPVRVVGAFAWALHVIVLAAAMVALALRYARADAPDRRRFAHATLAALSLIALALFSVTSATPLTLALAVLVVVAAGLDGRLDLPEMRFFIQTGAAVLWFRLFGNPGIDWAMVAPAGQVLAAFGGTIAAFWAALRLLRGRPRDTAKGVLESGAVGLVAVLVNIVLTRRLVPFVEASDLQTYWGASVNAMPWSILMLVQIYRLRLGGPMRRFRQVIAAIAAVLAGGGLFAAAIVLNPVLSESMAARSALVSGPPLLDSLALAYLLPAVLFLLAGWKLPGLAVRVRQAVLTIGAALLALFVGLEIRRFWEGDWLGVPRLVQGELYSYTVALMLVGAALLYAAITRRSALLRRIAMAVIGFTIVKVFLLDASGLSGLTRVVSFLGLGLSLAGLAWLNRWAGQVSREGATPAALEPSRPEPPSGQ